jgi:hypothetical protein
MQANTTKEYNTYHCAYVSLSEEPILKLDRARDLLDPGETALALFTRLPPGTPDDLFHSGSDGSDRTGNWAINSNHTADKVIVYLVLEERPRKPRFMKRITSML